MAGGSCHEASNLEKNGNTLKIVQCTEELGVSAQCVAHVLQTKRRQYKKNARLLLVGTEHRARCRYRFPSCPVSFSFHCAKQHSATFPPQGAPKSPNAVCVRPSSPSPLDATHKKRVFYPSTTRSFLCRSPSLVEPFARKGVLPPFSSLHKKTGASTVGDGRTRGDREREKPSIEWLYLETVARDSGGVRREGGGHCVQQWGWKEEKRRGDNSTVGLLAIPLFAVSVRT